jgi:tRNA 2-thiouridine synthesizing protein C
MISSFLIIHTLATRQQEAFAQAQDMTLALACFDQRVQCLFMGDGVYQLLREQTSMYTKRLLSYELYDLTPIIVCAESLRQRQLTTDHLIDLPMEIGNRDALQQVLQRANCVLSF